VFRLITRLAMAKELDFGDGVVYITDMDSMLDIMEANIRLNTTVSRIEACELNWSYLILFSIS
jgi:Lysine methyltransferase